MELLVVLVVVMVVVMEVCRLHYNTSIIKIMMMFVGGM